MGDASLLFLTLGAALLLSTVARAGGAFLHVPQVSLLMLLGVVVGPLGFDMVPPEARDSWYPFISEFTLAMVGFLLGGEFSRSALREQGRAVVAISLSVAVLSFGFVSLGVWAIGVPVATALVLGCAAVATDPAAVQGVIAEYHAEGPVSRTVMGVVAVDDLWGILLFSLVLALLVGGDGGGIRVGLLEASGGIALGTALGLAMAGTTGWLARGKPTAAEGIGFVLIASGLADALELPYLLTAVTMGAVVTNVARHHEIAFRQIEGIEWPFLVVFFVLSGATIDAGALSGALPALAAYIGFRLLSRVVAGQLGARVGRMETRARWVGFALLPQAGVALGLVLVVAQRLPEVGRPAQAVVVLGTVVFEVFGPILTRAVLRHAGEIDPPVAGGADPSS